MDVVNKIFLVVFYLQMTYYFYHQLSVPYSSCYTVIQTGLSCNITFNPQSLCVAVDKNFGRSIYLQEPTNV